MLSNKYSKILILILILFFLSFEGCVNLIPWKTNFFLGKWILPLQDTYFTIVFNKDGTFLTRGRKFCNNGTYKVINHQKNSALLKVESISNQFNTTLLVLRYREGLYIKWASFSQLWYSAKSEKGILIIERVKDSIQNLYELETWDHYYLLSFTVLGKRESDLITELEKPDSIQNMGNEKIYFYENKGEDESGNIYSYKFYILNDVVIRVENELAIKKIKN